MLLVCNHLMFNVLQKSSSFNHRKRQLLNRIILFNDKLFFHIINSNNSSDSNSKNNNNSNNNTKSNDSNSVKKSTGKSNAVARKLARFSFLELDSLKNNSEKNKVPARKDFSIAVQKPTVSNADPTYLKKEANEHKTHTRASMIGAKLGQNVNVDQNSSALNVVAKLISKLDEETERKNLLNPLDNLRKEKKYKSCF